jgi:hypothetical protein
MILSRSPIRKRRSTPRRGRVVDQAFLSWMHATQPCLLSLRVPGHICIGPKTFHHIRTCGNPKDDRRGLMLCAWAHQVTWNGRSSIEALGKSGFQDHWKVDIEAEIRRYNETYEVS